MTIAGAKAILIISATSLFNLRPESKTWLIRVAFATSAGHVLCLLTIAYTLAVPSEVIEHHHSSLQVCQKMCLYCRNQESIRENQD